MTRFVNFYSVLSTVSTATLGFGRCLLVIRLFSGLDVEGLFSIPALYAARRCRLKGVGGGGSGQRRHNGASLLGLCCRKVCPFDCCNICRGKIGNSKVEFLGNGDGPVTVRLIIGTNQFVQST